MNERLFCFKFDGKIEYMSIKDAIALDNDAVATRVKEIMLNLKSKRMIKDGFEPGYQDNINEYVGSKGEYDRRLRELGLIEIGYETAHIKETTEVGGAMKSEGFIEAALELGIDLNEQEIDAMKSGEYFDESLVNK